MLCDTGMSKRVTVKIYEAKIKPGMTHEAKAYDLYRKGGEERYEEKKL